MGVGYGSDVSDREGWAAQGDLPGVQEVARAEELPEGYRPAYEAVAETGICPTAGTAEATGGMKEYIRVSRMGETVSAKSVSAKMRRSPRWYGRTPAAVSMDLRLSDSCVRLYAVMALFTFQGNIVKVGMRHLGDLTGVSKDTVKRRIEQLVESGHLRAHDSGNGHRAWYELSSPVFAQKQRAGIPEVAIGPSGTPRMVSTPKKATA